jgi:hypothetical protein
MINDEQKGKGSSVRVAGNNMAQDNECIEKVHGGMQQLPVPVIKLGLSMTVAGNNVGMRQREGYPVACNNCQGQRMD